MNAAVATSFNAQLAALAATLNEYSGELSPESGFVAFVFHAVGEVWPSALRAPELQGFRSITVTAPLGWRAWVMPVIAD